MAEKELKFVDQFADALDPALRGFGQGADRVTSVKDFVDQVLSKLGPNDCIKSLTLIGHGSPGSIGVGCGKRVTGGNNALNLTNVDLWRPQINRLRCRFCQPEGDFTLLGCNTGAGLAGARLLRLIVNFIRCCRAKAPVEPVTPLTSSEVDQIVEAIGEGEEEMARLPEPIEAVQLKTVSLRPRIGPKSLVGGRSLASLGFYDPSRIIGARYFPVSSSKSGRGSPRTVEPALVSAIARSLRRAEVAMAPVALYAVEGYLQLRVQVSPARSSWLPPGALVGGFARYSPLGDDTTFLYALQPSLQRRLRNLSRRERGSASRVIRRSRSASR